MSLYLHVNVVLYSLFYNSPRTITGLFLYFKSCLLSEFIIGCQLVLLLTGVSTFSSCLNLVTIYLCLIFEMQINICWLDNFKKDLSLVDMYRQDLQKVEFFICKYCIDSFSYMAIVISICGGGSCWSSIRLCVLGILLELLTLGVDNSLF